MPSPGHTKRSKSTGSAPLWRHKRVEDAYVAKLVSPAEIFGVVGRFGGGDRVVAWIAARQLGLVTVPQLLLAGLTRTGIQVRVRQGRLHRIHRGVYGAGHSVSPPGARQLAAVLACGKDTFVSHRAAAALLGLARDPAAHVDVTAVSRGCRSRSGIVVHYVPSLDPADRSEKDGIPITSAARTVLDFASQATADEYERAIGEAYALELVTRDELRAAIERSPYRPGVGRVHAELDREGGPRWTQSEAERRMLRLISEARLPVPKTQEWIAGWPTDFAWLEQRLIVEVDGYKFHRSRRAFERDRKRDAAHVLAGYRVIRVTWRQLTEEPLAVAVTIARALGGS